MLFTLSKTNVFLLIASSIPATATAQASSTAQDDSSTFSAPPDPSPFPTATIFLPGSLHDFPGNARNLAASVITANENQTAYAIGCMYTAANSSSPGAQGCHLQSTITVTGGESTLIYTYNPIVTTDNGMPGTSIPTPETTSHSGATINCNMVGGTRATAATCTGSSQIEGLGRVGSSTTLASTQINYATLTVTAGRAMLAAASEAAAQASKDASNGEGAGDQNAASSLGEVCWATYGSVVLVAGLLGAGIL